MLDVRQLRYFVAVAEELHFGRAAMRLHLAQPALTRQIQQLEAKLGAPLFIRSSRKVELSPSGTFLLARARETLSALARAEEDTRKIGKGESGNVTIGFVHSATYFLLPTLLARFRAILPGVIVTLKEMRSPDQLIGLLQGQIDIGLIRPLIIPEGVSSAPASEERFVVALPPGHRLRRQKTVNLRDIARDPFVTFSESESPMFYGAAASMCTGAGFQPNKAQEATHVHTVLGLVSSGFGVAIVPEIARRFAGPGVSIITIADEPPPIQMLVAWCDGRVTNTALRFRKVVEEAFAESRR